MLWTGKVPRRTSGYSWVENTAQCQAVLWTDLHGILDIFQRTVDRYLELFAYSLGNNLESRPREPIWDVSHYQRARQVFVGNSLSAQGHAHIGMISTRYFPGASTAVVARVASRFALKNRSPTDLMSIPYVMDNIMAPGVL